MYLFSKHADSLHHLIFFNTVISESKGAVEDCYHKTNPPMETKLIG